VAREELNLRPLPCQIQRGSTGMYIGWLETGKDHWKAAGERKCHHPAAPTIRHRLIESGVGALGLQP
jgi:hypothetical protein